MIIFILKHWMFNRQFKKISAFLNCLKIQHWLKWSIIRERRKKQQRKNIIFFLIC